MERSREHSARRRRPGRPAASPIAVGVARIEPELRAAVELLNSRYASRGYRVPRETPGPSELTLIAREYGSTVGTLTLRFDGPPGCAPTKVIGEQIDAARSDGRGVCELGRSRWRTGRTVDAGARRAVRARVRASCATCATSPMSSSRSIRGTSTSTGELFGFAVAAGGRICPRVLAPSVLLRLEVAAFEDRMRDYATALWPQRDLIASPALN